MPYVHDVLMCATYGAWSVLYDNFMKHLHFVLGHTYTPTEVSNITYLILLTDICLYI